MTIVMAQQGWQCPNCGNIISPNMMWCPFCSGEKKVTYTTTTTEPSSSEKPNNCKTEPQTEVDWKQRLCDMYGTDRKSLDEAWEKYEADKVKDEPQFDKDINVRSKDEPQTDCPWK